MFRGLGRIVSAVSGKHHRRCGRRPDWVNKPRHYKILRVFLLMIVAINRAAFHHEGHPLQDANIV
jgi:hypothetical protein